MAQIRDLNAHDRPPESVRQVYKKYVKMPLSAVELDPGIVNLGDLNRDCLPDDIILEGTLSSKDLHIAFDNFITVPSEESRLVEDLPIFSHKAISG